MNYLVARMFGMNPWFYLDSELDNHYYLDQLQYHVRMRFYLDNTLLSRYRSR